MFSTRTIGPFELSPSNWVDWGLITAYSAQLQGAMGRHQGSTIKPKLSIEGSESCC